MRYFVQRIDPDGTPWHVNHYGNWTNYLDVETIEEAVRKTGIGWEGSTLGLLDYPILVKVQWTDDASYQHAKRFTMDHVVTHDYPIVETK